MIHTVDTYNSFQYYGVPRYVDIEIPEGYRVLEEGVILNSNHLTLSYDKWAVAWTFVKISSTDIGRQNEGFFCVIESEQVESKSSELSESSKLLKNIEDLNPILELEID